MYGFLVPCANEYITMPFSRENNAIFQENIMNSNNIFTVLQDVPYLSMPHILSYDECILQVDLNEWYVAGMVAGRYMTYPLRFV
jgi:hypothetical protein